MPLAKSSAPKSAYDYEQERTRGECKSPEGAQMAANMKALRLMDQTPYRSPKEADRSYNSNMNALKLLDEVAGGDSFKPQPAVPANNMDLSPKQYTGEEDAKSEGDDILQADDIKKRKSSKNIRREKASNFKALQLMDQSFGNGVDKTGRKGKGKLVRAEVAEAHLNKEKKEEKFLDTDDVDNYKSSETVRREKGANFKALKLIDESIGGVKHAQPGAHKTGKSMRAAVAEKHQVEARPKKLDADKKLESMATTTRKKKGLTPDDVRDPETVAGMKCKLEQDMEKEAEKKALKLAGTHSYASRAGIV